MSPGGSATARALVLFDDRIARTWRPFTLTRPAGELLFGALLQRERAERVLGGRCVGHLAAPPLGAFAEPGAAPVLPAPPLAGTAEVLYLSSRAVPAWGAVLPAAAPALLTVAGEPCGWLAPAGTAPGEEFFDDPAAAAPANASVHELGGSVLRHVWELVTGNAAQLTRDIEAEAASRARAPHRAAEVAVLGDAPVVIGAGVRLDPQVVLDARDGPIWLDDGVTVHAFTRLVGPTYVGRGGTVLGGALEQVSIGPVCKVHGQMEASVLLGYDNKAHAGFLGHSYLGRWVNLGALTTNSDLKNNYGRVQLWTPAGVVDTGEVKLGCFIGDHVRTAIGTLLNTGTVVEAGSNLFGGAMPPRHVPPFSWGTGAEPASYRLDRFLESVETAMARRDVTLTDAQRRQLGAAWQHARRA